MGFVNNAAKSHGSFTDDCIFTVYHPTKMHAISDWTTNILLHCGRVLLLHRLLQCTLFFIASLNYGQCAIYRVVRKRVPIIILNSYSRQQTPLRYRNAAIYLFIYYKIVLKVQHTNTYNN